MRENIGLYKGKRKDSGGWVYGYVFVGTILTDSDIRLEYVIQKSIAGQFGPVIYEVCEDTICEYAGHSDKKGVMIFEGDVCRRKIRGKTYTGEVIFSAAKCAFVLSYNRVSGIRKERITEIATLDITADIEVIGNIYDNPELLEGGAENE